MTTSGWLPWLHDLVQSLLPSFIINDLVGAFTEIFYDYYFDMFSLVADMENNGCLMSNYKYIVEYCILELLWLHVDGTNFPLVVYVIFGSDKVQEM